MSGAEFSAPGPTAEGIAAKSEQPIAADLHQLSPSAILTLFETQDRALADSLVRARVAILDLADAMSAALAAGGRIVYVGAGTSGRLGSVDAAEWPPTFGIAPGRIIALLAGGPTAFAAAVEGAEDREDLGQLEAELLVPTGADLWVGISASGGAPFVHSALRVARQRGARRAFITSHPAALEVLADPELIVVNLDTGAEVLGGSTRLQAASATQRVLQRASNLCAVQLGWIYGGHMVEMRPTNRKLRDRAERIVADLGRVERPRAANLLADCGDDIKLALVCARHGVLPVVARTRLDSVMRRLPELDGF